MTLSRKHENCLFGDRKGHKFHTQEWAVILVKIVSHKNQPIKLALEFFYKNRGL